MDASHDKSFLKLTSNLDELTKNYRLLLDLLRREKDLLIGADIEKLNQCNHEKENLLYKIRTLDSARERYAKELAQLIGADVANPRLLELSKKVSSKEGDRLRTIHATLEILIKRVTELNKENEQYASSALSVLNGAMDNIKETLVGKKTYAREGKMSYGPEKAGNFVRKEI